MTEPNYPLVLNAKSERFLDELRQEVEGKDVITERADQTRVHSLWVCSTWESEKSAREKKPQGLQGDVLKDKSPYYLIKLHFVLTLQ